MHQFRNFAGKGKKQSQNPMGKDSIDLSRFWSVPNFARGCVFVRGAAGVVPRSDGLAYTSLYCNNNCAVLVGFWIGL